MDIEKYAMGILQQLSDNKIFNDLEVKFENVKTDRELVVKRLHWWMKNMEGDIMAEAPMTCITISQQVMRFYDLLTDKDKPKK